MKALILGATGHIGNAIARELSGRGYEVSAVSRRAAPALNLAGLPVRFVAGDHNDPLQLAGWIADQDIVVDAAAPYPILLQPLQTEALLAAGMLRMKQLLDVAGRYGVRFVFVSSFTTLKRWMGRMEDAAPRLALALHPYFELKQRLESEVIEAAARGLRAVIVNPTMCLGPWDLHERSLCLIPRLLCGEIAGSVAHMINVVDVREVATGAAAMLEAGQYGTPTLISGHNISVQMLFSWIAEIGGVTPPPLSMPAGLAAFASYGAELILGIAGLDGLLPSLAPLLIYEHEWLPPCAALQEHGIEARPLSQTLLDSVAWYRRIGYC